MSSSDSSGRNILASVNSPSDRDVLLVVSWM